MKIQSLLSSTAMLFLILCAVAAPTKASAFHAFAPYASAFVISAAKGGVADWMAQKSSLRKEQQALSSSERYQHSHNQHALHMQQHAQAMRGGAMAPPQRQHSIDINRLLAFFLFSGLYQGVVMEFVYSVAFPKLFGASVLKKVLASVAIISPLATMPLTYMVKSLVFRESLSSGVQKYISDVRNKGLLQTFWTVWIPVKAIAFSVIPPSMRVLFLTTISFFWTIVLSSMANSK